MYMSMFWFDWFSYFACNQLIMNIQTSINEPLFKITLEMTVKKDFLFFQMMSANNDSMKH